MRSIIGILLLFGFIFAASADTGPGFTKGDRYWNVAPEIRQWFRNQMVPGTTNRSCCNEADGEEVEEDIRDGQYWIKGGGFAEWTLVPDAAVLTGPNLYKQPVVWRFYEWGKWNIRCYAPGALT